MSALFLALFFYFVPEHFFIAAFGSAAASATVFASSFLGFSNGYVERRKNSTHVKQRQVLRASQRDFLTGLLNRRSFFQAARRGLKRKGGCAVLLFDIDHFKAVNDMHGHAMGDAALVKISRRIATSLRRGDVLSRFGGEEFAVQLCRVDLHEAEIVAEKIRKAVASTLLVVRGNRLKLSISGGGVCFPSSSQTSLEHALQLADKQLYAAKEAGRDTVLLTKPSFG